MGDDASTEVSLRVALELALRRTREVEELLSIEATVVAVRDRRIQWLEHELSVVRQSLRDANLMLLALETDPIPEDETSTKHR